MQKESDVPSILFMSTFPPRECGIATFTKDLTDSIEAQFFPSIKTKILAVNSNGTNIYNYPKKVEFQISDNDISDYIEIAKQVNNSEEIKAVSIQHEFGLFSGEYGDNILAFLEILKKPVLITFHSILPRPDERLQKVVKAISERVKEIVVMTKSGIKILQEKYKVTTPITVVPHGIPNISFESQSNEKSNLGFENRIILLSYGLVSQNKGYEYVIDAIPEIVKEFPNLLYLIIGETHPIVRKTEGESYRNFLEKKVKSLNMQKHVKFYNKYVTKSEIAQYLKATDIYISPSLTFGQITSGTLVNAMGCGRAVVSTKFIHAKDIINSERGRLVRFKKPKEFAEAIKELLSNQENLKQIEKNTYAYTRHMTWNNVAVLYAQLFGKFTQLPELQMELAPLIAVKN